MFATLGLLAFLASAPQATAPAAGPKQVKVADGDTVVCKRFVETGSLVKGYRTCKTKREWERDRAMVRANRTTTNACGELNGSAGC